MVGSEPPLTVPFPDRGWESWGSAPALTPRGPQCRPSRRGASLPPHAQPSLPGLSRGVGAPRAPGQEGAEGGHTHCLSTMPWGGWQV